MSRFIHYTDEELAMKAQTGNSEAEGELAERFRPISVFIARSFPIPGMDIEDRASEAMIGALKAIRAWSPTGGAKVKTFVKMSMKRVLIDAHRSATQGSAIPNSKLLRLDAAVSLAEDDVSLIDIIPADDDTEREVIAADEAATAVEAVHRVQRERIAQAIEGMAADKSGRIMGGFKSYAGELAGMGKISQETFADIVKTIDSPGQGDLFADFREGDLTESARKVYAAYSEVLGLVLVDMASGCGPSECADRRGITAYTAALIMAAVRESAGICLELAA